LTMPSVRKRSEWNDTSIELDIRFRPITTAEALITVNLGVRADDELEVDARWHYRAVKGLIRVCGGREKGPEMDSRCD
jgi:hypothetical protein